MTLLNNLFILKKIICKRFNYTNLEISLKGCKRKLIQVTHPAIFQSQNVFQSNGQSLY